MRASFVLMAIMAIINRDDAFILQPTSVGISNRLKVLGASPIDYYSKKPAFDSGVNRHAPKFRSTKSKAYGSMEEKRRLLDKILVACRNKTKAQFTVTEVIFSFSLSSILSVCLYLDYF
jgi:hypothetical protein